MNKILEQAQNIKNDIVEVAHILSLLNVNDSNID